MTKIDFNFLLTAQEHALFGSSVAQKYKEKPYTPLAVIDDVIEVLECDRRRDEKILDNIFASFYGEVKVNEIRGKFWQGGCTLEPLVVDKNSDNYGETEEDPMLIYVRKITAANVRQLPFPFARGEIRVMKGIRYRK